MNVLIYTDVTGEWRSLSGSPVTDPVQSRRTITASSWTSKADVRAIIGFNYRFASINTTRYRNHYINLSIRSRIRLFLVPLIRLDICRIDLFLRKTSPVGSISLKIKKRITLLSQTFSLTRLVRHILYIYSDLYCRYSVFQVNLHS